MDYNEIIVNNCQENDTIYYYLRRLNFSQNYTKNLRKELGFIKLNNKPCFITEKIKNGDVISLYKNPNSKSEIMPIDAKLNILYEDEFLIAVYKPSGIATMPTRSHYTNNLAGMILFYMQKKQPDFVVRIINRLDKDTAGIILVAKDSLTCNLLNNDKSIIKTYFAICCGKIETEMIIDKSIKTTKNNYGFNDNKRITSTDGKPAKTYVTPIKYLYLDEKVHRIDDKLNIINKNESNNNGKESYNANIQSSENIDCYTLCKMQIENGRTHQIRVHMSSIGHPLVGDEVYGKKSNMISHTALVCNYIEFFHIRNNVHLKLHHE